MKEKLAKGRNGTTTLFLNSIKTLNYTNGNLLTSVTVRPLSFRNPELFSSSFRIPIRPPYTQARA